MDTSSPLFPLNPLGSRHGIAISGYWTYVQLSWFFLNTWLAVWFPETELEVNLRQPQRVGLSRELLAKEWHLSEYQAFGELPPVLLVPGFQSCHCCQALAFWGDSRAGERAIGAGQVRCLRACCSYWDSDHFCFSLVKSSDCSNIYFTFQLAQLLQDLWLVS